MSSEEEQRLLVSGPAAESGLRPKPAYDTFGRADVGAGAGHRPPPSQVSMPYEHAAGLPPKPEQQEPNRAPERRYYPALCNLPYQEPYQPHEQPGCHPAFQHQAYTLYQAPGHPSGPQYPHNQQVLPQPPVHQPDQVVVTQQPPVSKPVKTSRKFNMNTLDANQYYLSICLFIMVCICCNPFPLICTIPAFMAARTAADANDRDPLPADADERDDLIQTAWKKHKRAQCLNISGAVILIVTQIPYIILVVYGIEGVAVALS